MKVWEKISGQPAKPDRETMLRTQFARFRRMQADRSAFDSLVADAGEKLGGGYVLDRQYLASFMEQAFLHCGEMVADMNVLSKQSDVGPYKALDRTRKRLRYVLAAQPLLDQEDLIIPLSEIDELDHFHNVGAQISRLAEVGRLPGVLLPDGFVFSYAAFDVFLKYNGIETHHQMSGAGQTPLHEVSGRRILEGTIPGELRSIVETEVAMMRRLHGSRLKFVLRGSPPGQVSMEDGTKAIVAVSTTEILNAWKKLLAAMFENRERATRPGPDAWACMAVTVTRMIESQAHGHVFTVNPEDPRSGHMLVREFSGDRSIRFELERLHPHEISGDSPAQSNVPQGHRFFTGLGEKAMLIERSFRRPQELTWVCDRSGDTYITEMQPLTLDADEDPAAGLAEALENREVLYRGAGKTVSPGIAGGAVILAAAPEQDMDTAGEYVLVTPRIAPGDGLDRLLPRAAAVLADDDVYDEDIMSLIRELHVPAIVGLGDAASRLQSGDTVTVDADDNIVYSGLAQELLNYQFMEQLNIENEQEYTLLRFLLHRIAQSVPVAYPTRQSRLKQQSTLEHIVRVSLDRAAQDLIASIGAMRARGARRLEPVSGVRLQILEDGPTVQGESMPPALEAVIEGLSASGGADAKPGFTASGLAVVSFDNLLLHITSGARTYFFNTHFCDAAEQNYIYLRISDRSHPGDLIEKQILWMKGVLKKYRVGVYMLGDGLTACRYGMPRKFARELLVLMGKMLAYAETGPATAREDSIEMEIQRFSGP